MAKRKAGLGRGLETLLSKPAVRQISRDQTQATEASATGGGEGFQQVPLDLIQPGRYQPRRAFSPAELEELAASIRAQGVVQPVVLRPLDDAGGNRYELVAGERRWRASQLAGLTHVPAIVQKLTDEETIAVALIENIQRQDLNAIEEATALQRLLDEFGMTHQQVADSVGRSRAAVSNLLRLLGLEPSVRALVEQGELGMGHARALLAVNSDLQRELAAKVIKQGLSTRATEALVKRALADGNAPRRPRTDPNIQALEQDLSDRLGAHITLQQGAAGKGRLIIRYSSLEELDGIIAHIK